MKQTDTDISSTTIIQPSSHSTNTVRVSKTVPSQCKICGAPALYSYFGAVSCISCKMFFKRNAEKERTSLKCNLDGHCQINMDNRHVCSSCRLVKCFSSGIHTDMIRSSNPKKKTNKTNQQKKLINGSVTTVSTALQRHSTTDQPQKISTLNLLESDQSQLNADQWNLLSNLIHCYDEHSGYSLTERFVCEQNSLPIKLRYKCGPVGELIASTTYEVQRLFENNGDFLLLCPDDRSILLHGTIPHVACLSATIALRQPHLYDNPAFFKAAETVYGVNPMAAARRAYEQLDSDLLFVKLILGVLVFSMIQPAVYTSISSINLINIKSIFNIQNTYVELLWRYLLYKYNHEHAAISLSNVIRCLFAVIEAVRESQDIKQHTDLINLLIEETEQKLIINSE